MTAAIAAGGVEGGAITPTPLVRRTQQPRPQVTGVADRRRAHVAALSSRPFVAPPAAAAIPTARRRPRQQQQHVPALELQGLTRYVELNKFSGSTPDKHTHTDSKSFPFSFNGPMIPTHSAEIRTVIQEVNEAETKRLGSQYRQMSMSDAQTILDIMAKHK